MDLLLPNRQDQYGFYQCGQFRSYSKLEAIFEHNRTGLPIRWNFNEDVFGAMDWKVEPTESLAELYKRRAQQIREKYDYIVLWLSGGADSLNIFHTFMENGIHIDEVVNYTNYDATGDREGFMNGEIFHVAIPLIKKAQEKNPNMKHRVIDISKLAMDYFTKKDAKFDWVFKMNGWVNPNNACREDVKMTVPEWANMINSGKRVGFIHGIDKPRIHQVKNHFYFNFFDFVDSAHSPSQQMSNKPWEFDEFFYWSPEAPLIPIKQGHVLKNFAKSLHLGHPDATGEPHGIVRFNINGLPRQLTLAKVHELIYPWWERAPFQAKAPSVFFTPRDSWFFNLPDSDPAKYSWRVGLEEMWRKYPDSWKKDPSNMSSGFKLMTSRMYDLGT